MASSQEDVDVFDSWEEMDNTEVLERKLKEILPRPGKTLQANRYLLHYNLTENDHIVELSCSNGPVNVILLGDNALRTQYVPPEPTVKILKRPTKDTQVLNGDSKPRQQFKTLKQREQEYAEARLRILGEAHSSEKEERICSIQNKPQNHNPCNAGPVLRLPKGPDGTRGFNLRR